MKETNWQQRHYQEVEHGKKNHPNNQCVDKKPHFLSVIENSPYFACDNCNTAWVAKIKYAQNIQLLYK